jgi:hypothetical protein
MNVYVGIPTVVIVHEHRDRPVLDKKGTKANSGHQSASTSVSLSKVRQYLVKLVHKEATQTDVQQKNAAVAMVADSREHAQTAA